MSENSKAEPFATTGSGKSEAEVAFDLLNKLKGQGVWGERNMPAILDMYAECLDAVRGYRVYEGQSRVETPVRIVGQQKGNSPQPAAQPAPPQVQQPVVAAQPQPAAPNNPVQTQQAQLQQQLYKQG